MTYENFENQARACKDFDDIKEMLIRIAAELDMKDDIDMDYFKNEINGLDDDITQVKGDIDNLSDRIQELEDKDDE